VTTAFAVVATALVLLAAHWAATRSWVRRIDHVAADLDPQGGHALSPGPWTSVGHLERAARVALAARDDRILRERRMRRALDTIPLGVVVAGSDGGALYHNEVGAQYSAARHGDALVEAAIDGLVARAIQGETCVETVELFDPPRRTLVITAVPLDPATVGPGAVVVIDDITERRRLEAVRRDFVANISHELKTPVGAIALLAETLVGEDDPDVTARLAGRMLTEAHRVGRTIDDLLELSSIEAEESPQRELVPVADILAGAVDRMRPAADQKHIALEVAEPPPHLTVHGDSRQLVSAVFNLLENAVKYSDEDSSVQVRAAGDDGWVAIDVQDHGIGIPPGDLERVFERFYRVDQARSRQTGGTGLGLAIVRHVVTNHHGEVLVESVEGGGTTFTLRLPVGARPTPETTTEAG
jgi:two-component system, OmpR family, sensor histidine kinase SenX3